MEMDTDMDTAQHDMEMLISKYKAYLYCMIRKLIIRFGKQVYI